MFMCAHIPYTHVWTRTRIQLPMHARINAHAHTGAAHALVICASVPIHVRMIAKKHAIRNVYVRAYTIHARMDTNTHTITHARTYICVRTHTHGARTSYMCECANTRTHDRTQAHHTHCLCVRIYHTRTFGHVHAQTHRRTAHALVICASVHIHVRMIKYGHTRTAHALDICASVPTRVRMIAHKHAIRNVNVCAYTIHARMDTYTHTITHTRTYTCVHTHTHGA